MTISPPRPVVRGLLTFCSICTVPIASYCEGRRYICMATSEVTTTIRLRMSHFRLSTTARYSRRCAGSCEEAAGTTGAGCARSRRGRSSASGDSGRSLLSCIIILKSLSGEEKTKPSTTGDFRTRNDSRDPRRGKSTGCGFRVAECGFNVGFQTERPSSRANPQPEIRIPQSSEPGELAQPLAPVAQGRETYRLGHEALHARVTRARRGALERVGGDRLDARGVEPRFGERRAREVLEARALPGVSDVIDARQVHLRQLAQARDEVGHVGRRPVRVADGLERPAAARDVDDLREKVLPARAVYPARTHHGRARRRGLRAPLAFELRGAVRAQGVRVVALRVEAPLLAPVEDVVGGDLDEGRAREPRGGRHNLHALRVDEEGALRVQLAAVNVRPGGAVDNRVGTEARESLARPALVGHVQPPAVEREDLVSQTATVFRERPPDHPGRARYQNSHILNGPVLLLVVFAVRAAARAGDPVGVVRVPAYGLREPRLPGLARSPPQLGLRLLGVYRVARVVAGAVFDELEERARLGQGV